MIASPALALILLLLAAFTVAAAAAASRAAPPPPQPIGCAAELLAMSKCVPYLAAAPNQESASPSDSCCKAFSAAAVGDAGGGVGCLCYLVRNSSMLGFPLNVSRISSLFSSCNADPDVAVLAGPFTLICLAAQADALPPLSMTPYVKPAAPPAIPPAAPAINETDHGGNASVPTKPVPVPSTAISLRISGGRVLVLIVSLICFPEALDPLTCSRVPLLLGSLMFLLLTLSPLSVVIKIAF